MDIKTEIKTLADSGFSRQDIVEKLRSKGYTDTDISKEYDDFLAAKRLAKWENLALPNWLMMLGAGTVLFLFLRFGNIGAQEVFFLLAIGAVIAFGLTIYFFIKDHDFHIPKWVEALGITVLLFLLSWWYMHSFGFLFLLFTGIESLALTIYFYVKKV